jgi:hypothetical protein
MTKNTLLLLVLAMPSLGCQGLGVLANSLMGDTETTKEAEFTGLEGHSVAVVIFSDDKVEYDYPYARLELGEMIGGQLREHVKGVTVVSARRVVRYQNENERTWAGMDKTVLGKALNCDYVLYVGLVEYEMREPGSINLYLGRIQAETGLYDVSKPEVDARRWKGQFKVVYPEDTGMGVPAESDLKVRNESQRRLSDMVAKCFYKHKVPKFQ